MTFTIPEFWCGFMAGIICLFLIAASGVAYQSRKGSGK